MLRALMLHAASCLNALTLFSTPELFGAEAQQSQLRITNVGSRTNGCGMHQVAM